MSFTSATNFAKIFFFQEYPGPSHRVKKTLKVEKTQIGLKESGVQLNLTIVDTPGFGDNVSFSTMVVGYPREGLNQPITIKNTYISIEINKKMS